MQVVEADVTIFSFIVLYAIVLLYHIVLYCIVSYAGAHQSKKVSVRTVMEKKVKSTSNPVTDPVFPTALYIPKVY